jgi:hypothetical protein
MDEPWTVRDVYLLTESDEGPVAVPDLELVFRPDGVELDQAEGEKAWSIAWSQLEELSAVERSVMSDGSEGVVVLVVERGRRRRHRFVITTSDAAATEKSIRRLARAHGLTTLRPRRAVSRLVNVFIAVAAAVVITALLLQATHVIHFF